MDRHPRRRSRKPLMWGGVLVVVGVVIGVVLVIAAFTRLNDKVSSFYRLGAPDLREVFFDEAGDYVIYDESLGLSADGEAPFEVTVTRTGTGLDVPVDASVENIEYDTAGNSGEAVFEFSIPAVGTYEIQTSVSVDAGLAQLAIGRSVLGDLLKGLVLAAVVGGGIIVLGILVAVLGSIPRRQPRGSGSNEATSGSREAASRGEKSDHGRSPLSKRIEAHRKQDELHAAESRPHSEPQSEAQPPPPPPPDRQQPPPPPPRKAAAAPRPRKRPLEEHPLPRRAQAPPRQMPPPDLTDPAPAAPEEARVLNNSLSVAGLDFDSEELSSLEPVAIAPVVMGLDAHEALEAQPIDLPSIEIVGLEVSDLDVIGLDSADDEAASLRP